MLWICVHLLSSAVPAVAQSVCAVTPNATGHVYVSTQVIPTSAFSGCTDLEYLTLADTVTTIGESAFNDCYFLRSVRIPDSVISIGGRAFKGNYNLLSVTIADSVTSIGASAFQNNYNLLSLTIPDSVTDIPYFYAITVYRFEAFRFHLH